MKTILTGERPTGRLHLGHYFGALKMRVALQDEYETFVIIADVQALTDNYEHPQKVRENVYETVLDNLAVGIDPKKSHIFIQSLIPEIAELTIFYANLVTIARLQRNPTVKTEIAQKKELFGQKGEGVTYGFLGYPVSQAADITAFGAHLVPVGEDQVPVIEQTREIVRKFNSIYGDILVEPEYLLSKTPRIKGLDGQEKMGKSLNNAIYLADEPNEIRQKVMNAVTDKNKQKKDDPADPKVCMVYYYHKFISKDHEIVAQECRKGQRGCVDCKKQLADNIIQFLKPIQAKRKYYEENPELVNQIILEGTKEAKKRAEEVLKQAKKGMKIDYF